MAPPLIERWLTAAPTVRFVSGCLLIVLLMLSAGELASLLLPGRTAMPVKAVADISRVKKRLRSFPPRNELNARLVSGEPVTPPAIFSAVAFCRRLKATFIAWKPTERGGELVAIMPWTSVPELFTQLKPYLMRLGAFTLVKTDGQLRLTLLLERIDVG